MTRLLLPFGVLSVAFSVIVGAAPASAAKAKVVSAGGPSACGLKMMPLATGNTWTYKTGSRSVVLKITNVGPGKDWNGKAATVVDVDETYNGKTVKTQWSCTATGGLVLPIDSFFWSGEPGGGIGETFTVKSHDKPWLVSDAEFTGAVAWIEIVKADVVRIDGAGAGVQHRPAQLSVERHAQLRGTETIALPSLGQFPSEKVVFELRGEAMVEDQKAIVPITRPATIWFARGVGVVKFDDAFANTWELAESNLVAPLPPAGTR